MSTKRSSTDLTQGSIAPLLVNFALPILVGQLFQNLYNSVDSIVVGQFVGTTALAAVTSSGDVAHLLVGFFTGLSAGSGILFARYFGAKDQKNLHDSIHTALAFSLIIGISMAVLGIFLTPWLLQLVACPEEVMGEATTYLRIYFAGILFTSLYNIGSSVLRAVGDSRDPLLYLIAASVTNIVLDVVFVVAFDMGVMGVAVATVISQLLSVVLVFRNMMRTDDVYKVRLQDLRIDKALMLQIVDLGLPSGIQYCIVSISNLFVQRYVNLAGVAAMSGIGAAKKVDKFVAMVPQAFGTAAATFVSQNIGGKRVDRAFKGVRMALVISTVISAVAGVLLYLFADVAIGLFTTDSAANAHGAAMLRAMMPLYIFQVLYSIYANTARGFGKSRVVMIYTILGMVGCRQLYLTIAMAINNTVTHIYYAYPVGWAFASLFVIVHYYFTVVRPYRKKGEPATLF